MALVPLAVLTVRSTLPVPAGAVTCRREGEMNVAVAAATDPNRTVDAGVKPAPSIQVSVPPASGPLIFFEPFGCLSRFRWRRQLGILRLYRLFFVVFNLSGEILALTGIPDGMTAIYPTTLPDAPSYQIAWAVGKYRYVSFGKTRAGTEVGFYVLRSYEDELDGYAPRVVHVTRENRIVAIDQEVATLLS